MVGMPIALTSIASALFFFTKRAAAAHGRDGGRALLQRNGGA
jgi:hypothetical protein